jgi:hypothetical protein
MNVHRPLRAVLFVYELIRLVIVIGVVVLFISPGGMIFPYLPFAAANALFPLITLFVCIRPERYRSYIFLYAAGKAVLIAASGGWIGFSFSLIRESPRGEPALFFEALVVFIAADALALLGGLSLNRGALPPGPVVEGARAADAGELGALAEGALAEGARAPEDRGGPADLFPGGGI